MFKSAYFFCHLNSTHAEIFASRTVGTTISCFRFKELDKEDSAEYIRAEETSNEHQNAFHDA
jgi:hypothetical protein